MPATMSYAIRKMVDLPYEDALARARAELPKEGFGVLTEIDIRAKLSEKLGVEFPPYMILGVCNPPFAHRALQADSDIGLLLPCNVVVYEQPDGRSVVAAIDPETMVSLSDNPEVHAVAREVRQRLERVIAGI